MPFFNFLGPYFWGANGVEIRRAALANRNVDPIRGEFLFPDGTYAVFPGNAMMEARSFEEGWIEGGKPLDVYVGLKKWNHAGENVTTLSKMENLGRISTRYVAPADAEDVRDLHCGGPDGQVKTMYMVLKLFWGSEKDQLGDYLLLPFARLERAGGDVRLSGQFVPPTLTISSCDALQNIVREIRDQVAGRSHQLEEYKAQRGIQTAEFGTRDMVYFLALKSLNHYVPLLFHLTEVDPVHPWDLYGILRQIVGELSTFSQRINALGEMPTGERMLPLYDHRDLYGCFSAAQGLISQLLDEITAGPEYVIRLVYDGTYFCAELNPSVFEARNRFYLVFKTEQDPKTVLQSLATVAKLSSREHLPILIARALPGIGLEYLPVPPQELPRRSSCIYFKIDHHNEQWVNIKKNNNIALYWDNAPEDLEVELMVVSSRG